MQWNVIGTNLPTALGSQYSREIFQELKNVA